MDSSLYQFNPLVVRDSPEQGAYAHLAPPKAARFLGLSGADVLLWMVAGLLRLEEKGAERRTLQRGSWCC